MDNGRGAGKGRAVLASTGTDLSYLDDGEIAAFGRGDTCRIRFAHDPAVPLVAGYLVVVNRRVIVMVTERRSSVEIRVAGRPAIRVAGGEGYSPAEHDFEVIVPGASPNRTIRVRKLDVARRPRRAVGL